MTEADWNIVKEKLTRLADPVKLKCDDYEVSIVLMRITQFKNGIFVYVNGVIKAKCLMEECEESKRFFQKVSRSFHSAKQKKELSKLPKRLQKVLKIDSKYSYYRDYWTSFSSLKKQLISQNKSIELINK